MWVGAISPLNVIIEVKITMNWRFSQTMLEQLVISKNNIKHQKKFKLFLKKKTSKILKLKRERRKSKRYSLRT